MSPLTDVQSASDQPLYNIGVVSRMTGLSMATLRAWERRYDFPESERTAGGHRLYSEKDVMRLRWVKSRIDEGMQTAQAIHALQHQEHSGDLTLMEPFQVSVAPERAESHLHLGAYHENLVAALTERDLTRADTLIGEALAVNSVEDLIVDVIGPAISDIGDAWERGEINVATEHLTTNYLRQRLLMWMLSGPPPVQTNPIVLACAPGEWHEGSLLILGALLRRRRWPVVYLGQAVPLPDLSAFVKDLKPAMIVTVAMTEESARSLVDWPEYLPEAATTGRPIFSYGGRIFVQHPEWRIKMRGLYLGSSFQEGLQTIERLM